MAKSSLDVKLATYTERLDRYIETQEALSDRLVSSIETLSTDVKTLQSWRNRVYGAKTGLVAVGLLVTHTVLVLGTMTALVGWTNNR